MGEPASGPKWRRKDGADFVGEHAGGDAKAVGFRVSASPKAAISGTIGGREASARIGSSRSGPPARPPN